LNSNFILFLADSAEKTGDEIFKKFKISATPTVLILDTDGSEIDWLVGYGPPPDKYLERLDKTVKGIDTFKVLSERYSKEPKNVEVVFKLAKKYQDRYSPEKALELYKEVLAIDPDGKMGTTDVYEGKKVTYTEYAEFSIGEMSLFDRKMDPEPIKAFIKKYPKSEILESAYSILTYYYRSYGSKEEATKFFEEYVSKYPDDPYVLNSYVSRIIRDKENIDRGIELAEKIKSIMKYNPDPSYMKNLAELYVLKGDKSKAEELFGKNFMEGKASSLAYNLYEYANFWVRQNTNIDSALEMIELAVRLEPSLAVRAALLCVQANKPERALEIYGPEYIKKHMDNSRELNSYAWFWVNQDKNLESALEAAKKSVELAPAYYNWDTLSLVYFKLKKYEDALKAEEKAIELAGRPVPDYEKRVKDIKEAMAKEKK
jgi:tetratricopeptide (TPR) repeat protein